MKALKEHVDFGKAINAGGIELIVISRVYDGHFYLCVFPHSKYPADESTDFKTYIKLIEYDKVESFDPGYWMKTEDIPKLGDANFRHVLGLMAKNDPHLLAYISKFATEEYWKLKAS